MFYETQHFTQPIHKQGFENREDIFQNVLERARDV